ncbi:MAG TPA: GAF domain-containing sensor histidine kinase [Anaerolineales bacterium]|nr:GAF domain-containing sensor histidine kinase [Anaerolineales bacterium]
MTKKREVTQLDRLESVREALKIVNAQPLAEEARAALAKAMQTTEDMIDQLFATRPGGRLEALYRVSQVLGTSLDLDEVLNQVMDAVIGLTGAERGFLMLLNPDTGELDLRAARNYEQETLTPKEVEFSRTVIQTVVKNGEGVVSTDAQKDPRFAGQDSIVFFSLRSILCAPLRARGEVIGVIYVDNRAQSGIFTPADLNLLNAFATQSAIAIENARLYTRTDKALAERVAELETLSKVDHELSSHLDMDAVTALTEKWALAETGASRCLLIHQQEDGSLALMNKPSQPADGGLDDALSRAVRQALTAGSAVGLDPTDGIPARLVVPVQCAGQPACALVVERHEPFGDAARQFLSRLSSRAAAAMENARLYEAVQEANKAKSKFVSVVTHELRIPMTSIKGYTDLLRQGAVGPINDMQKNFLGVIRNNVERMSALVSDLSDISHLETGRLKLNSTFLNLADQIQEIAATLTPRFQDKQQTLDIEAAGDLPKVFADPNRLAQVLTNLISNANKYTPNAGKVWVGARTEGDMVRVEVKDTGIGISEEDQAGLFGQFFRSESPEVREQQGWGLGLNVAKRLVALMGGEIGVISAVGQGSTFWFTLPTYALAVDEEQS